MRPTAILLSLLCVLSSVATAQDSDKRRARLTATIDKLCGKSTISRRAALIDALRKEKIAHHEEEFASRQARGFNIVCPLGEDGPPIVLSAHYDALSMSPGANDNATGCAALLEIVRSLSRKTARSGALAPPRIDVVFMGGGKSGHAGASDYCRRRKQKPMLGCLNLDTVGLGAHLVLGPRAGRGDNDVLRTLREAFGAAPAMACSVADQVISSDDLAFTRAGVDAVTLSCFSKEDAAAIVAAAGQGPRGRRGKTSVDERLAPTRDQRAGVRIEGVEAAVAAVERWLAKLPRLDLLPRTVRPDFSRDLSRFARSLAKAEPDSVGVRTGPHVDAMVRLGARGSMLALIAALEGRRREAALPVVKRLLETFASGRELREGLEGVFSGLDPALVGPALRNLYDGLYRRLRWNAEKALLELADG